MDTYQLKLFIFFLNIRMYGDITLDKNLQDIHYWDHSLEKVGLPDAIMLGKTLSLLLVAANNSESFEPEMLTKVEVIVDENAELRDDAFFERVMPIGAKGLLIEEVFESESLPIVNGGDVHVPMPWVGPSTIQLIAPDGFDRDIENNVVVKSLLVVVSPEIPQP